jgi:predicted secreted protein
MGVVGGVIVYLLLWWLTLFAVLPMRVKGVWEDDADHPRGAEQGAPVNPALWWKVKRVTLIAAGLWLVAYAVIASGVFAPDV